MKRTHRHINCCKCPREVIITDVVDLIVKRLSNMDYDNMRGAASYIINNTEQRYKENVVQNFKKLIKEVIHFQGDQDRYLQIVDNIRAEMYEYERNYPKYNAKGQEEK